MTKHLTPAQLARAMETLQWDNIQAAANMGVSESCISRYLNGKRPIPKIFCILLKKYIAGGKK